MWYELQYKKNFYSNKWWTSYTVQDPNKVLEYLNTSDNTKINLNDVTSLTSDDILYSKSWCGYTAVKPVPIRRVVAHSSKPEHKHV